VLDKTRSQFSPQAADEGFLLDFYKYYFFFSFYLQNYYSHIEERRAGHVE